MKIKIPSCQDYGKVWLVKYKIVGHNQYQISLSPDLEDAGEFDDNDYIKELCQYWFGEINEVRRIKV